VLVVAALLLAAFLPPLARPFFGWLGDVVAGWRRGEGAVWWLVVSGLLLLPAVVTPVSALLRRLGHRRARNREANAVVLEVARRPSRKKTVERAPAPSSR
ncbi:hypothetical protein, partial [Amycolatopsis kentuckyensis]|uniref:hypothetical protein n=1 Tax=Amycolatopsis kentuckyensis TaxID=218823 RepID=UPI0011775E27